MGDVIELPVITKLDLNPKKILPKLAEDFEEGDHAFVIRYKEGHLQATYSTSADLHQIIVILERAKLLYLQEED